jgi:tRNA (cmo5U34)-methyltransferase
MTDVPDLFNAHAGHYDAERRRLIPPYDAFYGTAVEAVRLADAEPRRILDLGAGTGILSEWMRAEFPSARVTLLDGAARMLDLARERLGEDGVEYVEADLNDPLPVGPWDAIVSSLAIHHLDHPGKRSLIGRVHAALEPGGVFVNAEQVVGPSPRLSEAYDAWHAVAAHRHGTHDHEWAAAKRRMAHDQCTTVEEQLTWLRDAGFAEVDCLFKQFRFAVLVAIR